MISAALLLTTAACADTSAEICAGWRPLSWAAEDTQGTKQEIKAHNRHGEDMGCWAKR